MKITLLGHEAALDIVLTGRPRSLASILKRRFEVELVTPIFSSSSLPDDLSEVPVSWKKIEAGNYPRFFSNARQVIDALDGDIIYALKPRPASFGLALLDKLRHKRPVLLDVDDWEKSMCYPYSKHWLKNVALSLPRAHQPNSYLYTAALEKLTGQADAITSVSSFFQKRYGGVILPNGCDTDFYDPAHFDRMTLRRERGVDQFKLIMFTGAARPHKGLEQLLAAVELLDRPDVRLILIGPETEIITRLKANPCVQYWGFWPPSRIPELLAMADLVVLSQLQGQQARGQMPIKLYQAMAMALPVVSTPQADIAEVLDNCGLLAPSADPADLAPKIADLLDNPAEAARLGQLARLKCQQNYSWDAMENILDEVLAPFL